MIQCISVFYACSSQTSSVCFGNCYCECMWLVIVTKDVITYYLILKFLGVHLIVNDKVPVSEILTNPWLTYDVPSAFRYNILGLAAVRTGDRFFDNSDGRAGALATALLENIEHMELHHIRQVLHLVVIPVVKVCPVVLWDMWLGQLLPPVLIHCHRVLTPAWRSLLQEGSVKGPNIWGGGSATGNSSSPQQIKSEVMKDKLLRDLTRETCHLLSSAASPALNRGSQIDQNQGDGGMDVMVQQFNIAGSLIG